MCRNVKEAIYITVHKLIYNNVVVSYDILMSPCLNKQKKKKKQKKKEKMKEGRVRKGNIGRERLIKGGRDEERDRNYSLLIVK